MNIQNIVSSNIQLHAHWQNMQKKECTNKLNIDCFCTNVDSKCTNMQNMKIHCANNDMQNIKMSMMHHDLHIMHRHRDSRAVQGPQWLFADAEPLKVTVATDSDAMII